MSVYIAISNQICDNLFNNKVDHTQTGFYRNNRSSKIYIIGRIGQAYMRGTTQNGLHP